MLLCAAGLCVCRLEALTSLLLLSFFVSGARFGQIQRWWHGHTNLFISRLPFLLGFLTTSSRFRPLFALCISVRRFGLSIWVSSKLGRLLFSRLLHCHWVFGFVLCSVRHVDFFTLWTQIEIVYNVGDVCNLVLLLLLLKRVEFDLGRFLGAHLHCVVARMSFFLKILAFFFAKPRVD